MPSLQKYYRDEKLVSELMSVENYRIRRQKWVRVGLNKWRVYKYFDIIIATTPTLTTMNEEDLHTLIKFAIEDSTRLFHETQDSIRQCFIPKKFILWRLRRRIKKSIPFDWIDVYLEPFADDIYHSAFKKMYSTHEE